MNVKLTIKRSLLSGRGSIFSASDQKRQRTGALQRLRPVQRLGARASVLDCGSPLPLSQLWRSRQKPQAAFSLIEMVGVLTVIAILAAALVPALIRQMDRIAGDQETAALKSFGDALQQSILRNRYIPGTTDWATNIATELGVDVANIASNTRNKPRFFLIDPNLRVGNNSSSLPYNQNLTNWPSGSVVTNSSGNITSPISPRVMIVSSIGRALPTNIVTEIVPNNNFSAIWDWNDNGNALPATSYAWPGWPNGDDLKVQRVQLGPLFVRLVLTANNSSTNSNEMGYYSIDSISTNNVPSPGLGRDGYFIKNSLLCLFVGRTNVDSQQVLSRDGSFVYEQNVWRSSLTGGSFLAGSLDLGSIVDKYLDAPENTNAMNTTVTNSSRYTGIAQQSVVVSNMIAYMKAYTNWAAAGFPNNGLKTTAQNVQGAMITAIQGQYLKNTYTPFPIDCPP